MPGRQRDHRRIDDAGEAGRHRADAEHDHEDAVDVDAERIDHHRILDAGAHDHAEPGAVEHEEQRAERDRDDADHRQPVGRIEHEAERRDARNSGGGGTICDWLAKKKRTVSTKTDAEAESDQKLVFVRPVIEVADDDALHHHAETITNSEPAITATMNDPV